MQPAQSPEIETAIVPLPPLAVARPPKQVLAEAREAAIALKEIIDAKPKRVVFNGETYLENEDWLTVARFYGVTSYIVATRYVEFGEEGAKVRGFEAVAAAFLVATGQIISKAQSMCLNDERNWAGKPLFQLRSMAQTRASSRVLRQVFGWVVVLAGYKPTPAEEMEAAPQMQADICRECGLDIWTPEEKAQSLRDYGRVLCRVCQKHAPTKLETDLRKSVDAARNGKREKAGVPA